MHCVQGIHSTWGLSLFADAGEDQDGYTKLFDGPTTTAGQQDSVLLLLSAHITMVPDTQCTTGETSSLSLSVLYISLFKIDTHRLPCHSLTRKR